ncbi:GSCOCG00011491001-RA-CDS, partial [Cotesia congregata]
PHIDEVRCNKWIHASRRVDLTVKKINKYSYVCSKHFIGGKGPTVENPDPVSATISKVPKARKKRLSTSTIDSLCSPDQKSKRGKDLNSDFFIQSQQNDAPIFQ